MKGRDINLDILRVDGYRKFCNKLFNATKFAMLKFDMSFVPEAIAKTGQESLVEKWILHKVNIAATEINTYLADRNFMAATTSAYNFWLYELCDIYIVCFSFFVTFSMVEAVIFFLYRKR